MQLPHIHFKHDPFAIKHFVTSYLLASVTDFEIKHNKSTVPSAMSLTPGDFTRLTCPPNSALAVGPLNNVCFLAVGGMLERCTT